MAATTSTELSAKNHEHKRSYSRYSIDLKGKCCTQDKQCATVEIKDFCLGGMFLTYTPEQEEVSDRTHLAPNVGDIVEIFFNLPDENPQGIHFHACVVRSDRKSLGVSFKEAESANLQRVLQYAKKQQSNDSLTNAIPVTNKKIPGAASLLNAIRSYTLIHLNLLIDIYLKKQSHILLEMADKSRDLSEQSSYFETLSLFENSSHIFKKTFEDEMKNILKSKPSHLNSELNLDENELKHSNFSLLEDDAIDDWIARSDITSKCESFHLDALSGIEQRLSLLYNFKIGKQNNPVGPEAFSHSFQTGMKSILISRSSYQVCCKIFRDVLKEQLGELYEKVNTLLINNNILPELQYQIKKSKGEAKSKIASSAIEKENLDTSAGNQSSKQNVDTQKLYHLISNLHTIKNEHLQNESNDANFNEQLHLPKFNTEEIVGLLSELTIENFSPKNRQNHDLNSMRSASLELLQQLQQSPEGQRIGPRETGIMEITGSLYESLFTDKIITNGVKEWLGEVEMPLLKEAIKDESVLADQSHIARRFINQLSQLELYNDDNRDVISNSVKTTIEGLLRQVSEQPGMDEKLITSVLKKVDALVSTQDKAYSENLRDVIDQCELQREIPNLISNIPLPKTHSISAEEFREWRKRVRRLKVGDWILFNTDSKASSRLKIAWITENYDQYVFVNLLGLMEGALNIDDLALQLETGASIVLDNIDEPAVDRAQYSMMQKLHNQLLHESTHDSTTGLLNRKEFESQLHEQLNSHSGNHLLCFIDLDYFDVINTTFGHEVGDQVLTDVANLLSDTLNQRGDIARVGGDQFAVLLLDCNLEDAKQVTEDQRKALSQYRLEHDDIKSSITFSSGILSIDLDNQNISRILRTAEAACKLAKGKGINQEHIIAIDDSTLHEDQKLLVWASKIDDSLTNDTLQLRYQPIVPIGEDGLTPHAEILLGVTDELGNIISPENFILAAERYRRMPEIDRWIVKKVFMLLKDNPSLLELTGGVAINLSGLSINDDSFIPFILEQIENSGIPTHYLCFEVTETAGVTNLSNASQFINEIKQTGCSFSLDDFGTGMSSYSYLKNLPVDYIKIDGSFVRDIESNDSDRAVVKSITEIGHFMGKKIIAECVEKESTIDLLREIGVDYAQGWAICKPKLFGK